MHESCSMMLMNRACLLTFSANLVVVCLPHYRFFVVWWSLMSRQFFKLKEYDDPDCTEDEARIQTAIYPVDMCTFIGK